MKIVLVSFPDDADLTNTRPGDKTDIAPDIDDESRGTVLAIINTTSISDLLSQI